MKCKVCGGEILLQDGSFRCTSCGTISTVDSAYENIEVSICYVECDASGRRTRDSIIAQEIYKKLEESKIATFYERISADGLSGEDLEASKLAAIQKAKIIIVLGTSVDHFNSIDAKYGQCFDGKSVIPFCVDVNPGDIPKTLSKIQAMSYSTIGWDKDLVKGVCNILGREQEPEIGMLYGQRKRKIILISAIAAIVAILLAAGAWLLLKGDKVESDNDVKVTEPTETTLSENDIYDEANSLLNNGKLVDAIELLLQIPDHPNSANALKKIYSKYEGYYQSGEITVHLEIVDNVSAMIEIQESSEDRITTITATALLVGTNASCDYTDNRGVFGTIELRLEDTGFEIKWKENSAPEGTELFFTFAERKDAPTLQIDIEAVLKWLDEATTYGQIKALGYSLVDQDSYMYSGEFYCRIKDTDIYLSFFTKDGSYDKNVDSSVLVGVGGPAEMIAPSFIGEIGIPFFDGDRIYMPDGYCVSYSYAFSNYLLVGDGISEITNSTPVAVSTKAVSDLYSDDTYDHWDHLIEETLILKVQILLQEKYGDSYFECMTVAKNDTHYLFALRTSSMKASGKCMWYKGNKKDKTVAFLREGPYKSKNEWEYYKIAEDLWFSEYFEFAMEFPDAVDTKPGTDAWNEIIEGVFLDKAEADVLNRYPQDADSWVVRETIAQNSKHFLICVQPMSLRNKHMCAWYRGNKADGSVSFVKEGPYATGGYQFSKVLWFKWYSDFAEEFPQLYSTFREAISPYLTETPYAVSIDYGCYLNPYLPEYDYDYEQWLPEGVYVIVEERYDEKYNLWGRLESGEGWICLTELWESAFWGYN